MGKVFLRFSLAGAAGVLLLTACNSSSSKSSVTAPSGAQCTVQAQVEKTTFPSSGGTGTIRVATNRECPWSASSQAGWVSLSNPVDGAGEGSIAFTVAANQDPATRNGRIVVNDQAVQISQEAKPCEFRVSSTEHRFDAAGGEGHVDLSASSALCEWGARADEPWIDVVGGEQGKGSSGVTFRVEPSEGTSRTGTLRIAGIEVRVEQAGRPQPPTPSPPPAPPPGPSPSPPPVPSPPNCTVVVGPVSFNFGAAGGSGDVNVSTAAGCAWTVESALDWVTFTTAASGAGPGVASFRVAASGGPARTGIVRIAGQSVTIAQASGCAFTVSPGSHRPPAAGGAASINVAAGAGCSWTAATSTGWLGITTGSGGSGPGRVDFTVQANPGPERTGTLVIAGRTVTVTQASGCRFDVSPSSVDAPPSGESRAIHVVATAQACQWSATSAVPWARPSAAAGTGTGPVQLTIDANGTPARTGTVTVAGQPVAVRQPSLCTFMMNADASSIEANGGLGLVLVFVVGTCTWNATTSADWIRIEEAGGTGSGFVRFTAAPNPGAARNATVTIAGMPHRVSQAGR